MKTIIWIIFIGLIIGMGYQGRTLQRGTTAHYSIFQLELSNPVDGATILKAWSNKVYGRGSLIDVAASNTHWDFFFICCYVCLLLLLHSNDQMQRENWRLLNSLLRLNLLIAIVAGLLDVGENLLLLYNFRHVSDHFYHETIYLTAPKFILSGWAVLVFFFSVIKTAIANRIIAGKQQKHLVAIS